jgi:hypothetical protein
VDKFNAVMKKHKTWYKLKKDKDGKYYKVFLTGYKAKHLIKTAGEADEGESGWIKDIEFKDEKMVETTTAIWKTWGQVVRIGRALKPSPLDMQALARSAGDCSGGNVIQPFPRLYKIKKDISK